MFSFSNTHDHGSPYIILLTHYYISCVQSGAAKAFSVTKCKIISLFFLGRHLIWEGSIIIKKMVCAVRRDGYMVNAATPNEPGGKGASFSMGAGKAKPAAKHHGIITTTNYLLGNIINPGGNLPAKNKINKRNQTVLFPVHTNSTNQNHRHCKLINYQSSIQ